MVYHFELFHINTPLLHALCCTGRYLESRVGGSWTATIAIGEKLQDDAFSCGIFVGVGTLQIYCGLPHPVVGSHGNPQY